ncbi:MAG: hypothetical protein HKN35_09760 [Woeseia sp.]|nr:hypothetical protein [Woeseia sp.]NNE61170.1 hypothetical protein [Woeseia sp.]
MKAVSLVFAFVLLSGCASTQNLAVSPNTLETMQGKSLTLIQRESPNFVAMTSGKGMFAVAGVGAAAVTGNKLVKENNIVDPAMNISRTLAENLANNYGIALRGETTIAKSDSVDELVKLANNSDYALDVATHGWSYIYDGFKFGDYFVGYSSKLRLIDVNTSEVISSGLCAYDAKAAGKSAVAHETLLANNAAYIKQELVDATDRCVQEFSANLFSAPNVARNIP